MNKYTNPVLLPASKANELSIRQANRLFRLIDESHLWPICNKFNVTERAIRRLRRARHNGLEVNPGLEYIYALDREIYAIVNNTNI